MLATTPWIVVAALTATTGVLTAAPASARTEDRALGHRAREQLVGDLRDHLDRVRTAAGVGTVRPTSELTSIAQGWSNHMAADHTLAHNPDLATQVQGWQVLGENVGQGPSVASIDKAFEASPDHHDNETNPAYTEVGFGIQRGSDGYLWVTVDLEQPQ